MENVGLMIKRNLRILLAIQEYYSGKYDYVLIDANKKVHTLIYVVHNSVIPDLLKEIFSLMHLVNSGAQQRYSVNSIYLKLKEANYLHGFNFIFTNSKNKEAVLQICTDIDFFTRQSFDALEKLETLT